MGFRNESRVAAVFLGVFVVAGCSSSSSGDAAGGSDDGGPGSGDTTPCTESLVADVATQPAANASAAVTQDGAHVLFAWLAGTGKTKSVTIAVYGVDGSTEVAATKIGSTQGTSIDVAGGAADFGIAWESLDDNAGTGNLYPTVYFGTIGTDGKASRTSTNDVVGKSGPDDYVSASEPQVVATADGYVVTWNDNRTLYPAQQGVNMANANGIYGRRFAASGPTDASDVQIMQDGHTSWAAAGGAVVWIAYGNNGQPPDGALQIGSFSGTSGKTLMTEDTRIEPSLFANDDGSFVLTMSSGAGASGTSSSVAFSTVTNGQAAKATTVDASSAPHSSGRAFATKLGTTFAWLEGSSNDGFENYSTTLKSADFDSSVHGTRAVGDAFSAAFVTTGAAAAANGGFVLPIVARTKDGTAHLQIATICPGFGG